MLVSPVLLLIYWTNIYNLIFLFKNYAFIIVKWLKFRNSFKILFPRVSFLKILHLKVLFFGFLVFIFESLIIDLFVSVYKIIIHWYWNLSLGMFENCLWSVFKLDMRICLTLSIVEGSGEVNGLVFTLVHVNWLIFLI